SADMAFALEPFLSSGAALAIKAHASDSLKERYLEKINTGEWSGTMNLTESGAGSDLGPMKTRAERHGDHYKIFGQKIYITWGDHDATENIIHLVLARLPDAPAGSKGISLFLVPKFLVNDDGSLGERNDAFPVSTEHKLGIHGSPTCVMAYGDNGGAIGYLVGEENNGLACMFTMMNEARLKVGLQGIGASEGAYQKAVAYARERVQGGVAIIEHADVKRMLTTMRALIEGMRALAYTEAVTMDLAHYGDADERSEQQRRIDLMIPVIKGWCTEVGLEVTSLGVQVHGGMGYVEETGAAQFLRDVRITPIYEGTNGIQAADLVNRKVARDGGATMEAIQAEIKTTANDLASSGNHGLQGLGSALSKALAVHVQTTQAVLAMAADDRFNALGGAFDYMMQTGYLFGGWQLGRSALIAESLHAEGERTAFCERKMATAAFYGARILPRQSYGRRERFFGPVETIACFEDNSRVAEAVAEPGGGRVLVVDGQGSLNRSLLGDNLAQKASDNGWAGLVIIGAIRDVEIIDRIEIGVKALGVIPVKTEKQDRGDRHVELLLREVTVRPTDWLYADRNGVLVSPVALTP
ncbi:MAG: ribonuclease E inhibitor RraA, partial [Cellvibrionales bacterium]|nr:ribonuclease E inhibitor RraA [Cellvibrionales bacterium]